MARVVVDRVVLSRRDREGTFKCPERCANRRFSFVETPDRVGEEGSAHGVLVSHTADGRFRVPATHSVHKPTGQGWRDLDEDVFLRSLAKTKPKRSICSDMEYSESNDTGTIELTTDEEDDRRNKHKKRAREETTPPQTEFLKRTKQEHKDKVDPQTEDKDKQHITKQDPRETMCIQIEKLEKLIFKAYKLKEK
ncbi:hypothetical protein ABEB36_000413 [Hypothenemus hampei]|uniref:Uncharacterized protein n=1 Tax=Hypothenemus hampei TaxID=57062 RepID=A0ABD1FDR8_HYPHA